MTSSLSSDAMGARAFTMLYTTYYDTAVSIVRSFERECRYAEDIVQDVFVKMLCDQQKLQEIENIRAYLYILIRNQYLSYKRKNGRTLLPEYPPFEQCESVPADQKACLGSALVVIESALQQLPPKRRRVFRLSRLQGFSHKEIADHLQIHPVTVAQYIMKSMESLDLVKTELRRLCA